SSAARRAGRAGRPFRHPPGHRHDDEHDLVCPQPPRGRVGRRIRALRQAARARPEPTRCGPELMNHTTWEPDLVSPSLVSLTRLLGEPTRDLVVLAEGNTSEVLDNRRLVMKASGAAMMHVTSEDFVVVDMDEVMTVVDDPATTQADLSDVLVA